MGEDFDWALERILAGLQTSRVITEKEKRVVAYHEAGHALVAHLLGDANPIQKVTIVPRGTALGYTLNLPEEDRYIRTRDELIDEITMLLSGRAAEHVVFGRISTGAANDLERVTTIARAMVFEYGMGESVTSRTMRADNYALSEETKRLRDARAGPHRRRGLHRRDRAVRGVARRSRAPRDRPAGSRDARQERGQALVVRRADPLELRHGRRRGPDASGTTAVSGLVVVAVGTLEPRPPRLGVLGRARRSRPAWRRPRPWRRGWPAPRGRGASADSVPASAASNDLRPWAANASWSCALELLQLELQLLTLGEPLALLEPVARELLALLEPVFDLVEESHSGPPFVVVPRHCRILARSLPPIMVSRDGHPRDPPRRHRRA